MYRKRMDNGNEYRKRWEPISALPTRPIARINLEARGRNVVVKIKFDNTGEVSDLKIDFGCVESFKVYEEFSDFCSVGPQPLMPSDRLGLVAWPFQEVVNSQWLERVVVRNGAIRDRAWRHFAIFSLDTILHVMTDDPFRASFVN